MRLTSVARGPGAFRRCILPCNLASRITLVKTIRSSIVLFHHGLAALVMTYLLRSTHSRVAYPQRISMGQLPSYMDCAFGSFRRSGDTDLLLRRMPTRWQLSEQPESEQEQICVILACLSLCQTSSHRIWSTELPWPFALWVGLL